MNYGRKTVEVSNLSYHIILSIMLVDFICQLDWSKGCPDSWWIIISGCICKGISRGD